MPKLGLVSITRIAEFWVRPTGMDPVCRTDTCRSFRRTDRAQSPGKTLGAEDLDVLITGRDVGTDEVRTSFDQFSLASNALWMEFTKRSRPNGLMSRATG